MKKRTHAQRIAELKALGQRLKRLIRAQVQPFEDTSPAAARARREACRNDPEKFKATYLPQLCRAKSPAYFADMHELVQTPLRGVIIRGFRGCAKTTELVTVDGLMDILYQREKFVGVGSDTTIKGATLLAAIRANLRYNERIKADFGELLPTPGRANCIIANGVCFQSFGFRQSPRGLTYDGWRFSRFIIDDIETKISSRSAKHTSSRIDWIKADVIPAMEPDNWRLAILGQRLHRKGVLYQLAAETDDQGEPLYLSLEIKPVDEQGNLVWPERFSHAVLDSYRRTMGHVEFGAEFMDLPADNKGLFPDNWFEDGRAEYRYEEIDPRRLMIVTVDDPSMGLPDGDPSAIGTIGWDPYQGHFLVLECYIERVRPEVNALTVKAQAAPYPSSTLVVESTLFQDLLRKAIAKHCKGMPVMRFERYTPKELDIGALSPLIEMGLIKFDVRRGHTRTLIDQLRGYGEPGMHDDGPDMLSIGIQHLQYRLAGDKNDYQTVAKREVYEAVREF